MRKYPAFGPASAPAARPAVVRSQVAVVGLTSGVWHGVLGTPLCGALRPTALCSRRRTPTRARGYLSSMATGGFRSLRCRCSSTRPARPRTPAQGGCRRCCSRSRRRSGRRSRRTALAGRVGLPCSVAGASASSIRRMRCTGSLLVARPCTPVAAAPRALAARFVVHGWPGRCRPLHQRRLVGREQQLLQSRVVGLRRQQ